MAGELPQGAVRLSSPVTAISQDSRSGCVVETANGGRFACRKVVVSVPTTLYPKISFSPSLPPAKNTLANSTALGYYSKTVFVFGRPWWREAGLSGAFLSQKGPAQFCRDTVVEADGQYSLTMFHVGDGGRQWSKFSKAERRRKVLDQFRSVFGAALRAVGSDMEIPDPTNVLEKEWSKDPWIQGAPNPVMGPGVLTSDAGASLRAPFGDVHFVGTELSLEWKGYMEGAVRSGETGAAEVVAALKQ